MVQLIATRLIMKQVSQRFIFKVFQPMGGKYFFLPGCKRTVICIKFIHVSDQHGPSSEHNCHIKESQIESKVERLKRESANTKKIENSF